MMWGVFAELEHDIIVQRIKSGLANAREKGKTLGRPKTTIDNIPSIFYKYYPMFESNSINLSEFARLCQISRVTIYKYINIIENHKP